MPWRDTLAAALEFARSRTVRRITTLIGLLFVLLLYVIWAARVIPGYRYQINPDGTGYIGVAQKYLAGHCADAVNAYWSPLYSWLLVPLLAMHIPPLLAVKILDAMVGAVILCASWSIMGHIRASLETRLLAVLTLMPIVLHFGMTVTTPDLLVAATALLYLAYLTRPGWAQDRASGVITGLLGAACYLAKAYALPFWIGHFALSVVIVLCRDKEHRGRILRHTGLALAALAIVCGAWATALRCKYGRFTLGSTARFNLAYNGPAFKMPMRAGLLPPPNATAVSAWEDPTYMSVPSWDPRGSPQEREHFHKNFDRNTTNLWNIAERFNPHYFLLLAAAAVLAATAVDPQPRSPGSALVLALVLWPCGYLLLHVEQRFLFLTCFLLLLAGTFILSAAASALRLGLIRRTVLAAVLCWSFLYVPTSGAKPKTPPPTLGRWSLAKGWFVDRGYQQRAEALQGLLPARARAASDDRWSDALYLSFYLDLTYYGVPAPTAAPDALERDLRRHGVEYFLVYGNPGRYPWLKGATDLALSRKAGVRIYRVPPMPPQVTQPFRPASSPASRPARQ